MSATASKSMLKVSDLCVQRGTVDVLNGVSFDLAEGEFLSVIGPSGCGKSTLLAALTGEVVAVSGTIELNTRDAATPAAGLAWMPQTDSLLPWLNTVENATLGLEIAGVGRKDAIEQVLPLIEPFGLAGFEQAWPHQLSGGMRQRVALLRTVALGRPVLLLDEPFGALDALTRSRMQEWLSAMQQQFGWTVLLITHDVREAVVLSDRVLALSPRPAAVAAEVTIDIPRPRASSLIAIPRCGEFELQLLEALKEASGPC